MGSPIVVSLLGLLLAAYVVRIAMTYVRMRGRRIVVCPETRLPATVAVDAGHSAVGTILNSEDIRLQFCSRWPEREDCDQACTPQIAAEPRATLVSAHVQNRIKEQTCAICHRPFDPWHAVGPQPGLLNRETGRTTRWDDIPPAELPTRLEIDLPVCKHCQLLEDFRRQYPDRVVDRHRTAVN
jgi:hypothetical protein